MRTASTNLPPKNSTNVRFRPRASAMRRLANAVAARVFPARAERLLRRVMLTPRRPSPAPASDLIRADTARRVPYGNRWLRVWRFGEGPLVLLVHGWSGHAAQFEAWIEPLVSAGYRVVAFDAPAHGLSGGRRTNIMDMAGAIQHVAGLEGPLHAIVAHSFGVPAALFALGHGLPAPRLVSISAPLSLVKHSILVAQALGLPMRIRGRMQRAMERALEFRWDATDTDAALATLMADRGLEALLVHDRKDREVPFASSERIAAAAPRARLLATEGNGHVRILRNAQAIGEAISFIGGRQNGSARHAA